MFVRLLERIIQNFQIRTRIRSESTSSINEIRQDFYVWFRLGWGERIARSWKLGRLLRKQRRGRRRLGVVWWIFGWRFISFWNRWFRGRTLRKSFKISQIECSQTKGENSGGQETGNDKARRLNEGLYINSRLERIYRCQFWKDHASIGHLKERKGNSDQTRRKHKKLYQRSRWNSAWKRKEQRTTDKRSQRKGAGTY